MEAVFIGFGSNLGHSEKICREAVKALRAHPGIEVLRTSSFYRTEPVGMLEQPWFVNGVALCETRLDPEGLLAATGQLEDSFGRVRRERWGPRTLDLDILLFGDRRIELPSLVVPHPRLHERRFVLVPLVEIAPSLVHPVLGLTMRELLDRLPPSAGQEVKGCEAL